MKANKLAIIEALVRRRAELRLSQAEVARLAGIGQSYLSAIEIGKHIPRTETLTDLALALRAELLLVPDERLAAVRSILGETPASERRLFNADPD